MCKDLSQGERIRKRKSCNANKTKAYFNARYFPRHKQKYCVDEEGKRKKCGGRRKREKRFFIVFFFFFCGIVEQLECNEV